MRRRSLRRTRAPSRALHRPGAALMQISRAKRCVGSGGRMQRRASQSNLVRSLWSLRSLWPTAQASQLCRSRREGRTNAFLPSNGEKRLRWPLVQGQRG